MPRWLLLSEGRCCSWRGCVLFVAGDWALRVVAACVGVTADMMQRAAQSKLNMVDALVTTYLRNSVHAGGCTAMQGRGCMCGSEGARERGREGHTHTRTHTHGL